MCCRDESWRDDGERRVAERAQVHGIGGETAGERYGSEIRQLPTLQAGVAFDGGNGADNERGRDHDVRERCVKGK